MINLQSVAKLNELRIGENLTSIRDSREKLDNLMAARDNCDAARNTVRQSQKNSVPDSSAHALNIARQNQGFSLFCAGLDAKIKRLSQKLSEGIEQRKAEINTLLTKNKIHQHKRDVALEKIKNDKKTRRQISEINDVADCEESVGVNHYSPNQATKYTQE